MVDLPFDLAHGRGRRTIFFHFYGTYLNLLRETSNQLFFTLLTRNKLKLLTALKATAGSIQEHSSPKPKQTSCECSDTQFPTVHSGSESYFTHSTTSKTDVQELKDLLSAHNKRTIHPVACTDVSINKFLRKNSFYTHFFSNQFPDTQILGFRVGGRDRIFSKLRKSSTFLSLSLTTSEKRKRCRFI